MTKKQKERFKDWNIAQGQAKERAHLQFKNLQKICKDNNITVYCNASINLENILTAPHIDTETKQFAIDTYRDCMKNVQRFDCLIEMLEILR